LATKSLNQARKKFLANAELFLIIFFLFFSEAVNISEQQVAVINLANYLFTAFMVLRLWKRMMYVMTLDLSIVILVSYTLCSMLWSVDPDYTLRLAIAMLRTTFFGIYLATCFSLQNHLRILAWISGWAVSINLFVCIAFPSFGIMVDPNSPGNLAFAGIYSFKQYLGRMMALSLITLIIHFLAYPRSRWLSGLTILGAAALLLLSQSRTYQVGAILAILLFPLYQITKQGFKLRTFLLIVAFLVGTMVAGFVMTQWEPVVVPMLGKGVTLNGRTPIWTLALEQLMKRPLFGYGYSAFWSSDEGMLIFKNSWAANLPGFVVKTWHAHNAFLDLSLQLGLIGLLLLLVSIILVLYRTVTLMNINRSLESFWMLQVLTIQLLASSSEIPTHLSSFSIYWIIYVVFAYSSAIELQKIQHRRSQPQLPLIAEALKPRELT
jgi:exopolysaccharide production protein ExoQ